MATRKSLRAERAKKNRAIAFKGIRTACWTIKESSVTFISLALAYLGRDLIPSLVIFALNIIAAQYRDRLIYGAQVP